MRTNPVAMTASRRRFLIAAGAAAAAVAAGAATGAARAGDSPEGKPAAPGATPAESPLVVHEWGTFTSMQGANGVLLEGLNREEESLPSFVYDRSKIRDCPLRDKGWKGLEVPADHVTQKMETPVIYFHSATSRRVRVRVDFMKGLLTQWYPVSDLVGPPEGPRGSAPLDVSKVARSFLQWDVNVMGKGGKSPPNVPKVAADDPWAFAREVDASWLVTAPRKEPERAGPVEAERYLFYRGLGNFPMPLDAQMWQEDDIVLMNRGDVAITDAVAFEIRGDKGRMTLVDSIAPGKAVKAILEGGEWWGPAEAIAEKLAAFVEERLRMQGLREDEARAMVRTWSRSWFRSEGTRVLWFVPRATVDAILPLSIDPAPQELVRVLVGRAEVIPPRVEKDVEAAVRDRFSQDEGAAKAAAAKLESLGRFLEPQVRNVLARTQDESVRGNARRLLEELAARGD
jgi:hypothetical protein